MQASISLQRTRISIQYTDAIFAAGLTFSLQQQSDFEVCQPGSREADLVVCDYATGLQIAKHRRSQSVGEEDPRLLVLTNLDQEHIARQALECGIQGYLLTNTPVEDLVDAVRGVAQGKRVISPGIVQKVLDSMSRESLTPRETEVLNLLAAGLCNKRVADRLQIAVGTVKVHVKAILSKLDVASRTHAVSVATQRGLVKLAHTQ